MFITKKKYEEAIKKVKYESEQEIKRKVEADQDRFWFERRNEQYREDVYRRLSTIEQRLHKLEKMNGLVEDEPICPFAPKASF